MIAIAQGGASSVALPRVVATWIVDGFLVDLEDPDSMDMRLVDPLGEEGEWAPAVNEKLTTGRYVLEFEIPEDAELGTWFAEWRTETQAGIVKFEVVAEGEPIPNAYATVAQARAEGIPITYTDQRIANALVKASREIENLCRRRFGPHYEVNTFNGRPAPLLILDREIVAVDELALDQFVVDNGLLKVVNGFHEKGNNKIEWRDPTEFEVEHSEFSEVGTFTQGKANVEISGLWGFVEPSKHRDLEDLAGEVPELIVEATINLAMRRIRRSWAFAPKGGATVLGPIQSERTREQSVTYGKASNSIISYTGDPEVDRVIAQYRRNLIVGIA